MVWVRFQPSGKSVRAPSGTTLLDAARRAGLPVASACGAGGLCGRCGVSILKGSDRLSPETESERRVKRNNRIDAGQRLACRACAVGDVQITASYW